MYIVEVKSVEGWTTHSSHRSYRGAADQADMVHGRIAGDAAAWRWAAAHQGFAGSYDEWSALDDDERAEFERGAAGIPTA